MKCASQGLAIHKVPALEADGHYALLTTTKTHLIAWWAVRETITGECLTAAIASAYCTNAVQGT